MGRRVNDGDRTGMKLDRFRNSDFEFDRDTEVNNYSGVSRKTINTLGGVFQENRGRRSGDGVRSKWDSSPFENGKVYNWNHRQGWDQYYEPYDRGNRNYGGAQLDHDGTHFGKGPKGYKRADDAIYDDVCSTLSLSGDVDASDIEVEVKEGVIFLRGSVSDRNTKKMAEFEIENISGVKDVQNYLSIKNNKDLH